MQVIALAQGFLIGLGLLLAIGAQNAFVLRLGLRGEHVALVCLTCAVSDALLITVGVAGFAALMSALPWIDSVFRWLGVAFLTAYALRAWYGAVFGSDASLQASSVNAASWQAAMATCLALTWLNPHVYLDTVVLLGSVSSTFEGRKLAFGAGAVSASFVFFFALGYGARLLRPLFSRPIAWRALDVLIGVVMLVIAFGLVTSA